MSPEIEAILVEADHERIQLLVGLILGALAIVGGCVTAIFWHRGRVAVEKAREETKCELAAYVAEGTMSAEDAQTLGGKKPKKPKNPLWGM